MDFRLSGLLSYYVLISMLLEVQSKPLFLAQTSCDENFNSTVRLIKLLKHQAGDLHKKYINLHGPFLSAPLNDVPESTVSGTSISEKLQDVYIKNVLFSWHILKVEEYLKNLCNQTALDKSCDKDLDAALLHVKGSLANLRGKMKMNLMSFDPETPLPTTPAPPQLFHTHDFAKKKYGFGVTVALKDWLTQVLQLLESKEVCDRPEKSDQE